MDKNKRQFYLWDENMELFNSLPNKSRIINILLRKYKEETDGADQPD